MFCLYGMTLNEEGDVGVVGRDKVYDEEEEDELEPVDNGRLFEIALITVPSNSNLGIGTRVDCDLWCLFTLRARIDFVLIIS